MNESNSYPLRPCRVSLFAQVTLKSHPVEHVGQPLFQTLKNTSERRAGFAQILKQT